MSGVCCIRFVKGDLAGVIERLPDEGEVYIGRHSKCPIRIVDSRISRHQARLFKKNGRWLIEAVSQKVPTFVGGKALTEPHILQESDVISIGNTDLEFEGSNDPQ